MTIQEENRELLKLFEPLRVADVRDGMDWMGYHFYGTLDKNIRPLWRTKMCGIARTARYLPYEGPTPNLRGEEYTQWSNWYYNNVAIYPWIQEIEEGDVIVADGDGVIAVPRAVARDVAKYASRELHNDKNNRKAKYDVLGWEHDATVINEDE